MHVTRKQWCLLGVVTCLGVALLSLLAWLMYKDALDCTEQRLRLGPGIDHILEDDVVVLTRDANATGTTYLCGSRPTDPGYQVPVSVFDRSVVAMFMGLVVIGMILTVCIIIGYSECLARMMTRAE